MDNYKLSLLIGWCKMIINKCSIISKKQKKIILIVSIIVDVIAILLLIFSILVVLNSDDENIFFALLINVIGTISLTDFLSIISKRSSLAWKITSYFNKRFKNTSHISVFELSTEQRKFCDKVIGLREKNSYIYLYGIKGKGKTTAVLYLLDSLTKCNDISEIPWSNNLTFVDCTSQKEEVLNFFGLTSDLSERINKFNNSLVVIDNIEKMGKIFLNENIDLFSSSKSLFLIIEDTDDNHSLCDEVQFTNALFAKNFDTSVIGIRAQLNLYDTLLDFDDNEKKVFFALCIATISNAFTNIKDIRKILRLSIFVFNKALRKILSKNIFHIFPFNSNYLYCLDSSSVKSVEEQFQSDLLFNTVLKMFINSAIPSSECRWLCLVKSEMPIINSVPLNERIKLFNSALYDGNYKKLYDVISNEISKSPEKDKIFTYEKGFLSFHVGNHKEATELFWSLINNQETTIKRKEIMLNIIQSNHGDPDQENMNAIYSFISYLKQDNDFYSICAQYWETHISSEKGEFGIESFHNIRHEIKKYENNPIKNSIVQRCFTDEIRCYHILGRKPPMELYYDYRSFLKKGSIIRFNYFYNLYVEANDIHYIRILESVLCGNDNIQELADSADYFYELSLSSSYGDEKSLLATKIKHLDLKMVYADFNFEDAVREINLFRARAQMNNVKVQEAYCETLLIKASVLNPQNFSNDNGFVLKNETLDSINLLYCNAKETYIKYNNEYGIMRLDFLLLLIELLNINLNFNIDALNNFSIKCADYFYKEQRIIKEIIEKIQKNELTSMYILSIIRCYPIILQ